MDRRKFLVGAAATAIVGPSAFPTPLPGAPPIMRYMDPVYGGKSLSDLMIEASRVNGSIQARFMIPQGMNMLKPGTWEITPNEAPRSSEDQPV